MKSYRASVLNIAAFLVLLISTCIISRRTIACDIGVAGPSSFIAAPGSSQTQTWTIDGGSLWSGYPVSVSIDSGSDVFILSQMPVTLDSSGTATFTITFTPGPNATGTFYGSIQCPCGKPHQIVGTIAAAGVTNVVPAEVSFTVSPNPAINHLTFATSGVRSAEIGIYDLLGKEIASSKSMNWELDASGFAPGTYIARITGESFSGDPFVVSRRIIIER